MGPIHIVQLDKARPTANLTREGIRSVASRITVAPTTTVIRGLSTKVEVGATNGLDSASVVSFDNLATVPIGTIYRHIGYLLPQQEAALTEVTLSSLRPRVTIMRVLHTVLHCKTVCFRA